MTSSEEFNIVIVSDLHLSEGRNPETNMFGGNEYFPFDDKFDRFLSHLETESERRGRKWRLIIAGDMVDFLRVTKLPADFNFELRDSEKKYGLGTYSEKTVWKIKVIMDGHWIFFRALGKFISSGNKCTIITGNHDIEWTIPEVQQAFRAEIKKYLPKEISDADGVVSNQIEFCPWFYYEPGLIWVEHGNQYDGLSSFDYLLFPYLPDSDELMLPVGSFFVRYMFNKVELEDPFAANVKPPSVYLKKYWFKLFLALSNFKPSPDDLAKFGYTLHSLKVRRHLGYLFAMLRKVRRFRSEELEHLRQKNEEAIKTEGERFGINIKKLEVIKQSWVPCYLYNKSKLRNIWSFIMYKAEGKDRRMASVISEQLDVPYVVFGHTHKAGWESNYINSGTWTIIFSNTPSERLINEESESVFVQILKDEGNKLELMKWRDDLGRGIPPTLMFWLLATAE